MEKLYLRIRGRVLGPYELDDIRLLIARGQFGKIHEVSDDALNWTAASECADLFPGSANPRSVGPPTNCPLSRLETEKYARGNRSAIARSVNKRKLIVLTIAGVGVMGFALSMLVYFGMSGGNDIYHSRTTNSAVVEANVSHADNAKDANAANPQPQAKNDQVTPENILAPDGKKQVDESPIRSMKNEADEPHPSSIENLPPEMNRLEERDAIAALPADAEKTKRKKDIPDDPDDQSTTSPSSDQLGSPKLANPKNTDNHYIASTKEQENIKFAVGMVVVGLKLRNLGKNYEVPISTGSAFFVGLRQGIMLTNRHVIEDYDLLASNEEIKRTLRREKGSNAKAALWVIISGEKYPATLLHSSPKYDCAIIQAPCKAKKIFRLKTSSDRLVDEDIRAIGFPSNARNALSEEQTVDRITEIQNKLNRGKGAADDEDFYLPDVKEFFLSHAFQYALTKGTVCQIAKDDVTKTTWLQHTANISSGNSGGPIVLSDGTVVGINTVISGDKSRLGSEFYRAIEIGQMRSEIDAFVKDAVWVP